MVPRPLCKLLVVAVCSCGVSEELFACVGSGGSEEPFTHWSISWGAQASPSSTPPSLPKPSTGLCFHLPSLLGQPFRTRNYLDSWWESLVLTLSQKMGCKFTTFFDKVVITQMMTFCHPVTSCKSLLFQYIPTTAFPVPRSVLYLCFYFQFSLFFVFVSAWEMLWPVEIEHIFAFLHCVKELAANKANSFIRCCLQKYL